MHENWHDKLHRLRNARLYRNRNGSPIGRTCPTCGVALRGRAFYCSYECKTLGQAEGSPGVGYKHKQKYRSHASITLPKLSIQEVSEMSKPNRTGIYNCRSTDAHGQYIITKFDKHFEVESSYLVSRGECACPAGRLPTCRHRQMLLLFMAKKHVDDGFLLNHETNTWSQLPAAADAIAEREAPAAPAPVERAEQVPHPPAAAGAPKPRWMRGF
jgi:hypothetical protein